MALHQAPDPSKLIFAPAGSEAHGQAEQFTRGKLSRGDLDPTSPVKQFHAWFAHAQASHAVSHPETCTLSTAHLPSGRVSSRMVYLKELASATGKKKEGQEQQQQDEGAGAGGGDDEDAYFVVYTNLGTSRKAADLATNPRASLCFWWEPLQRQVRVEGATARHPPEESQAYFDTRVRGSRIGAWASRQSAVLPPSGDGGDDGRAQLEAWVREAEERFAGEERIPVPDFWGGLRIIPDRVEFWQGRESRLHDRFVYELVDREDGKGKRWQLERLSP